MTDVGSQDPTIESAPIESAPATLANRLAFHSDAEPAPSEFWNKADRFADRFSDFVNPILVKEIRQALKSRSFLATFGIVLLLGWGWSIFGVALRAPAIYYVPGGRYMLLGYFLISLLPFILIVPFSTFRSLAAEREDGTYELLSITDLKPWKIILGKLGGAWLQIAVYLSALTPCFAITYFLRGIDIVMILLFVGALILASSLLCALALVIAAQARNQRFQAASAIFLLLILIFCIFASASAGITMIVSGVTADVRNPDFWTGMAMVISMVGCIMTLFVLEAAASITFPSDNRATPIRAGMLLTHAIWFGWIVYFWHEADFERAVLYAYVFPTLVFWWFAGARACGESTELTPRVRRGLPQSFAGRLAWTLFFPGRGLGYLFAVSNLAAMLIAVFWLQGFSKGTDNVGFTAAMGFCYVVAYVGIANLILRFSARYGFQGAIRGVFANIALVVFGCFIPLSIHLSNTRRFSNAYHQIEASNPFWTMAELTDGNVSDFFASKPGIYLVPIIVSSVALLMLAINFVLATPEIMAARAIVPTRVEEEQATLKGIAPEEEEPKSPFD